MVTLPIGIVEKPLRHQVGVLTDVSCNLDNTIKVGGFLPTTTIDFPGRLSAVIFTHGCPWRCVYCHNAHLLESASSYQQHSWSKILKILNKRRKLLDGVVFSGGEPTVHRGLEMAIGYVKDMGFEVGLHTGGGLPDRFAAVIEMVDWVGFDIKTHKDEYPLVTQRPRSGENAYKSLDILLQSGVDYEVRTTVDWNILPPDKLITLAKNLAAKGVRNFVVQPVRFDDRMGVKSKIPNIENPQKVYQEISGCFDSFQVR